MNKCDRLKDGLIVFAALGGLAVAFNSVLNGPDSDSARLIGDAYRHNQDRLMLDGRPYLLTSRHDGSCMIVEAHRIIASGVTDTFVQTPSITLSICP